MADLDTILLGGVPLPVERGVDKLVETTLQETAVNRMMDGSLVEDFFDPKPRSWSINWVRLCEPDFATIYALWQAQYTDREWLTFVVPRLAIDTVARIGMSPKDIKSDGNMVVDFSITLDESLGGG